MPRPATPPPSWAQLVLNYIAPGKPWDGQPNQVPPTSGLIGAGLEPSQRVPGPLLNWLFGVFGTHLVHLDGIEVQNWTPEVSIGNIIPTNQSNSPIVWDSVGRQLWAVGPGAIAGLIYSSPNGITWTVVAQAFSNLGTIVASPANGFLVAGTHTNGPAKLYYLDPVAGPPWVQVNPPNAKTFNVARWNQSIFIFGGQDTGNHPGIWTGTGDMSGNSQATVQGSAGYTGQIKFLTVSSAGIGVAFGDTAGFPAIFTEHFWTITGAPSGTWIDQGPISGWGAHPPCDLAWDESRGVFVAVMTAGEVYQSVNGTAWVLVAGADTATRKFQEHTLAINGGLYVAMVKDGNGVSNLSWSGDGGITWSLVPWPFGDMTLDPAGLALVDDRFALMTQDAKVSFSLRLK